MTRSRSILRHTWLLAVLLAWSCAASPPSIPADDVDAAFRLLDDARDRARTDPALGVAERVVRLTRLGLWEEAETVLAQAQPGPDVDAAAAMLSFRRHRYDEAEARVRRALGADPSHREARLMQIRLAIQAWTLDEAAALAEAMLAEHSRDEEAALLLGRVRLLEKRYDEALGWARRVQRWNRRNAEAHLLEADVRFWDQDPAGAEPALVRALELDPFDPDARFGYGYAIWRRVDATQLDAMAAQWTLALEVDPLHYVTHWHWGNGHTNLTYADYAHPTDSIVRTRLARAHDRIAANRIDEAIALTRELEREYPESVLPALTRGSAFYMAYEMDRAARLDSAHATFAAILDRKPNYGPAHNGLAAVIKQWQLGYLASFDSLTTAIEAVPLPDDPIFDEFFRDVAAYPGDRVRKMARQQLGPSIAYLPLLHRLDRSYSIPPLHIDLAEAMGNPSLRTRTTFDNRQWMDIRGIGGGAAGIEYVERGSHWERNVLLHEFVHLFHSQVLTDAEVRRIRELYHAAVEADRALDYYAANNEHEFMAQAYEAYVSPVKAHPLNHKAMNTHDDLLEKDPETYAFIDSMVVRQRAYLDGDLSALASNWAEAYVRLSERARRVDQGGSPAARRRAAAFLDSALVHDPDYLPAMLSYAALERTHGNLAEAERWLERAAALDPAYAPIHAARAELVAARAEAGEVDADRALEEQVAHYIRALELEGDLAERAQLNATLRTLYWSHGRIAEAVEVAEAYVREAPTLSTYLRDRRDEAAAFANELRGFAGAVTETLPFFAALVEKKPQHYELRRQYADALAAAGRHAEAVETLEAAQRILAAGGHPRVDFMVQIAEIEAARGDLEAARSAIAPVLEGTVRAPAGDPRYLRVLAALGESEHLAREVIRMDRGRTPADAAEAAYTRGWIAEHAGEYDDARLHYADALDANEYHHAARLRLIGLLLREDRGAEVDMIITRAEALPLPPEAGFRARVQGEVAVER